MMERRTFIGAGASLTITPQFLAAEVVKTDAEKIAAMKRIRALTGMSMDQIDDWFDGIDLDRLITNIEASTDRFEPKVKGEVLPSYLAEWRLVRKQFNEEVPEEGEPLYERLFQIEDQIMQTRAVSTEGILAQIEFAEEEEINLHFDFDGHRDLFENIKSSLRAMV